MQQQMISHRSVEYQAIHKETIVQLQDFLDTMNQIFLFSSTGTGFMEASIRNCVSKKILCCINGSFGRRFHDVALANGKIVEKLEFPLGDPITPERLDEKLKSCPDVEAVSIVHNETSTGLINPLEKLAKTVKNHNKILLVDAVSSLGGTVINVDKWNLDVCFTSSQKCFGIPPGLAFGSVSDVALQKSERIKNKGWYFDFQLWERYQRTAGTPVTSAIPQILGLNKMLKLIREWGGKTKIFDLYKKRNKRVRKGVESIGLKLFPKRGYESPTVSCILSPPHISSPKIFQKMREHGFELAKGHGSLSNRTFRIGNMGYINFEDIELMLDTLDTVIKDL
jgi:aspartate aminotransferase-like enzyme